MLHLPKSRIYIADSNFAINGGLQCIQLFLYFLVRHIPRLLICIACMIIRAGGNKQMYIWQISCIFQGKMHIFAFFLSLAKVLHIIVSSFSEK